MSTHFLLCFAAILVRATAFLPGLTPPACALAGEDSNFCRVVRKNDVLAHGDSPIGDLLMGIWQSPFNLWNRVIDGPSPPPPPYPSPPPPHP